MCASGKLKGCSADGKLVDGQACPGGACRDAGSCKDCDDTVAGNRRCSPSQADVVQLCMSGGSWVSQPPCDPSAYPAGCDGGNCVVCTNGSERCIVSDSAHPNGKTQTCQGNQWVDSGTYCSEGCGSDNITCCAPTVGCPASGACTVVANDGCGRLIQCDGSCPGTTECFRGRCVLPCMCGRNVNGGCIPCCTIKCCNPPAFPTLDGEVSPNIMQCPPQ
jgi:hypothetical protein